MYVIDRDLQTNTQFQMLLKGKGDLETNNFSPWILYMVVILFRLRILVASTSVFFVQIWMEVLFNDIHK